MSELKALTASIVLILAASQMSAQTPPKISTTNNGDFGAADMEMEKAWNKTYASMKQRDEGDNSRGGGFGFAAATLESQRAWLAYRDRQCIIEGGQFAGKPSQPEAQTGCKTRLTRERTVQLHALQWK